MYLFTVVPPFFFLRTGEIIIRNRLLFFKQLFFSLFQLSVLP
ncbi:hypothetical protein BACCAP_02409 [Pseudoflavonifractor capillosus ATCC 29799]|uniref:Uncharacterized protein n=1 Tax=Pseudoflavonifractor capillosus ATCC 29799 TaxID=411467 RepID=A6NW15_9FIRM|nr:hypothetical protein BACCAP_02409 [Pseudoflavonifractor capillosus ATCC 29799]